MERAPWSTCGRSPLQANYAMYMRTRRSGCRRCAARFPVFHLSPSSVISARSNRRPRPLLGGTELPFELVLGADKKEAREPPLAETCAFSPTGALSLWLVLRWALLLSQSHPTNRKIALAGLARGTRPRS